MYPRPKWLMLRLYLCGDRWADAARGSLGMDRDELHVANGVRLGSRPRKARSSWPASIVESFGSRPPDLQARGRQRGQGASSRARPGMRWVQRYLPDPIRRSGYG
jgi:hypothetical protein